MIIMIFLMQLYWTQVFEVIPNVSNTIQQTSSAVDGSSLGPGLIYIGDGAASVMGSKSCC